MAKGNPQRVSREQIIAIISAIELACTILNGLIPILKDLINRLDEVDDIIAGK